MGAWDAIIVGTSVANDRPSSKTSGRLPGIGKSRSPAGNDVGKDRDNLVGDARTRGNRMRRCPDGHGENISKSIDTVRIDVRRRGNGLMRWADGGNASNSMETVFIDARRCPGR
jgi:hypothetical protein